MEQKVFFLQFIFGSYLLTHEHLYLLLIDYFSSLEHNTHNIKCRRRFRLKMALKQFPWTADKIEHDRVSHDSNESIKIEPWHEKMKIWKFVDSLIHVNDHIQLYCKASTRLERGIFSNHLNMSQSYLPQFDDRQLVPIVNISRQQISI